MPGGPFISYFLTFNFLLDIIIFVRRSFVSVPNFTSTSNINSSAIFQCRMVPKVANERYCNVVLIFGVVWGTGVKG